MKGDCSELEAGYYRDNRRKVLISVVILLVSVVMAFGSIFLSQIMDTVTPDIVIEVLKAHLNGGSTDNHVAETVVWDDGVPPRHHGRGRRSRTGRRRRRDAVAAPQPTG